MKPYLVDDDLTLWNGDALAVLRELPDESVHMAVTSPPYWGLRDYGEEGQLGLEPTPEAYVERMVEVFREVRRVLRSDGTCWLNIGDSYNNAGSSRNGEGLDGSRRGGATGSDGALGYKRRDTRRTLGGIKHKDLCMIPARLALALQEDGWWIRSEITWGKPNPMPESVVDRPTSSTEKVYLLAKSARYFYDPEPVREEFEAKTAGTWSKASHDARSELGRSGTYRREYHHPSLHGAPQEETLGDLPGEAPRGADGRRKTARVEHHEGRQAHANYENAYGGERWPAGGRNMRNLWMIATEPYADAHFAVFPRGLVRRCILAGTSEKGCCPECGTPWEREVERVVPVDPGRGEGSKLRDAEGLSARAASAAKRQLGGNYQKQLDENPARTVGWNPGCECAAPPVPCVVLDPFGGSGTTALVAREQGRRAALIELSEDYCALIARRTQQLSLLGDAA